MPLSLFRYCRVVTPLPVATITYLFQSALRTVDAGLENVSLLADDVDRSAARIPLVTSDYNERASESNLHKAIEALRSQVQRGLPIDAPPIQLIVRFVLRSLTWMGSLLFTNNHTLSML